MRLLRWKALALSAALLCATGVQAKPDDCASFGTSVHFVDTPKEAAKWAEKEGRLVLVLHVSGHFEKPQFT